MQQPTKVSDVLQNLLWVYLDGEDVLRFIDANALHGIRIGHVDVHLLASVRLTQASCCGCLTNPLRMWPPACSIE